MSNINENTSVGEVVRDNFERARVFESHGIDFCCGGDVSVAEACLTVDLDPGSLITELKAVSQPADRSHRYIENLPPVALSTYISDTHHSFVREQIPYIMEKLNKLCDVHGAHHPELFDVREMFGKASDNLMAHMKKEEEVLFPAIRYLAAHGLEGKHAPSEAERLAGIFIELKGEHQAEGDRFREMDQMTEHFQVPPDGCNTFRLTYHALNEFVSDLHRHIHLENNILFPEIEKQYLPGN